MNRLGAVVVIALIGFAAAFFAFRDDADDACLVEAPADPSYEVRFVDGAQMDQTTHVLEVTHDGAPVSGARVCVNVAMVGMSAMGAGDVAREVAPGRYEVSLTFEMGGPWEGKVLIADEGTDWDVAIPVEFDVMSGSGDDMDDMDGMTEPSESRS